MRQSVEDVKHLAGVLGGALDSAIVQEDFGQLVVRLEVREFTDRHASGLKAFAVELSGRKEKGGSVSFDSISRRVFYLPCTDGGDCFEPREFNAALKEAGLPVAKNR